jgi:hypothetical protein
MEGPVRKIKESKGARHTHFLENTAGMGQGTERKQGREGHSLSRECKGISQNRERKKISN